MLNQYPNVTLQFTVQDCKFVQNNEIYGAASAEGSIRMTNCDGGGALFYASNVSSPLLWRLERTAFVRNQGGHGGAVALKAPSAGPLRLEHCRFDGQLALRGGGLYADGTHLKVMNVIMRQNAALWGGGISSTRGSRLRIVPDQAGMISVFENNSAVYGGGIHHFEGEGLCLRGVEFRRNVGFRHGGGIRLAANGNRVVLEGIALEENSALVGGGISAFQCSNLTLGSSHHISHIRGNTAAVGGGFYLQDGGDFWTQIKVTHTEFSHNRALKEQSPEIQSLIENGRLFRPIASLGETAAFPVMGFIENQSLSEILAEVPSGEGGALCMTFHGIRFVSEVEVQLNDLQMENNEAVVGGGASLHFARPWIMGHRPRCFPFVFGFDFCQRVYFMRLKIQHNRAEYAGGMFLTHPENVRIGCDVETAQGDVTLAEVYAQQTAGRPGREERCLSIAENEITDGAEIQGADIGSSVKAFAIEGLEPGEGLGMVASSEVLASPDGSSNGPKLLILDAFNQTISRGTDDAELKVSLSSQSIVGTLRYAAQNGSVYLNSTYAYGFDRSCHLHIQDEGDPSISLDVPFFIRACLPGEIENVDACVRCSVESYSLNASLGECQPCEEHAVCMGGTARVPQDGYWHCNPFSPQFHRCMNTGGCRGENRTTRLTAFHNDTIQLSHQLEQMDAYLTGEALLPQFPDYQQCAPGYEGVLCGSCQEGYGHCFNLGCHACPTQMSVARVLLLLSFLWALVAIGVNALMTLLSARTRVQLVRYEARDPVLHTRERQLQRTQAHIPREIRISRRLSRRTTLSHPSDATDAVVRELLNAQLVATVQLTETLKILINYLQITSSVMRLALDWNPTVHAVLSIEAALVGVAGPALSIPFECLFKQDKGYPASIVAAWMRLLIPFAAMLSLILLLLLGWTLSHFFRMWHDPANRPTATKLVTGVVIVVIVAGYFTYIDAIREFFSIINCIPVGYEDLPPNHPYRQYAVDPGEMVWTADTDLVCFKGMHKVTGAAAVCGIVLSFLCVVLIVLWLPLNKHRVTKTVFVARYWFLYQAYKKKWCTLPWEAVIFLRKTLIAAILVFSYHTGTDMQAVLCVGVLFLAYVLQVMVQPFKVPEGHTHVPEYAGCLFTLLRLPRLRKRFVAWNNRLSLNALEAGSLFSSFLVYYAAVALSASGPSDGGKDAMIDVAIGVNLLYLWYVLYRLYCGLHIVADLKLEIEDPTFMATHDNSLGFLNLMRKGMWIFRNAVRHYLEVEESSVEQEV